MNQAVLFFAMKRLLALLVAFAFTACSGTLSVRSGDASVSRTPPAPGSSVQSSQVGLQVDVRSGSSTLFGLVVVGLMIGDGIDYFRGSGRWTREAPPLAEGRKINRQDCTQPISITDGNLMCR